MTEHDHRSQRQRVLASAMLADTPEDRHGTYPRRLSAIPGGTPTAEQIGRSVSGIGILVTAMACHPEKSTLDRHFELWRLAQHLRGQVDALDELLRRNAC